VASVHTELSQPAAREAPVNRRALRDMTVSLQAALRSIGGARLQERTERWPSRRYQNDPVAFAREVLGVEPWERQIEILEAIRDHKKVAIRSGHKVSKSHSLAIAALWFFSSFEDARVVCTCVTARQVDEIFYRECRKLHRGAKVRLDGEPRELARSGIRAPDLREIVGFTAKEAEAVAGVSGKNLMYLVDEASGVPRPIFEAIQGNRAGGARVVMTSNPTQCEGVFFEAFEPNSTWKQLHISSLESPNVKAGREVIPNLAGPEWVEEMAQEYGRDSAIFKVRVEGEFVRTEEGKIISLHLLTLASQRWEETPAEGRLRIGIDPSGWTGSGDEGVFTLLRGLKALGQFAFRGLDGDGYLTNLLGFIKSHGERRETPIVLLDQGGEVGIRVRDVLAAHLNKPGHEGDYELFPIDTGKPAMRQPQVYGTVRDELWANLAAWLRAGGAIPGDAKLSKELHAPSWHPLTHYGPKSNISKATDKRELRKLLDRSPDRADSLCLAAWEPSSTARRAPDELQASRPALDPYDRDVDAQPSGGLSPYESPVYGRRGRS
jgi:phage terminase large subunit